MSSFVSGYQRDDGIVVTAAFTNSSGTATNPTTVTFYAKAPDGTITPYVYGNDAEVTNPATGTFKLTLTLTSSKGWVFRVKGTGAVAAADWIGVEVDEDVFG